MDVDAMDELMYDNLIRYFKTLAHTGYKSYDVVFKMLVMDFIYEITHTELRYYITNEDIKLMRDLLYQFFGSTCEVSLPTNRPCCECVCCDGGSSTPPPVIVSTTTTTTSTSTQPPVVGNNVYYGVVEDYMSPLDFVDIPINTLMEREGTKSKTITGTEVNKFTIPQNGYYTYLIVPVNKVELQYADFTSGGITTVCYDNTKENIPDDTNNGIFYSKYTRGGVNANQGGTYNGINYDVYFVYNNYGGAPELINVKAKNK